jgi:hypothetical protein
VFSKLARIAERHRSRPQRARASAPPPSAPHPFDALERGLLDGVVGGRVVSTGQADPSVIAGLQGLSQAISAVGQTLGQAEQKKSSDMLQVVGQIMKPPGGEGDKKKK